MTHTPEQLSVASRRAAAFLAHYAAHDSVGMTQTVRELDQQLSPDVERFVYALACLGAGMGVRRLGLDVFVEDMRAVALARAVDTAGPADGMPPAPTDPGGAA